MKGLLFKAATLIGLIIPLSPGYPALIQLKSGKTIDAQILGKTERSLKVDYNGKILFYKLYYIDRIEGIAPENYEFFSQPATRKKDIGLEQKETSMAALPQPEEQKAPLTMPETDINTTGKQTLALLYQQAIDAALNGELTEASRLLKAGLKVNSSHARLWEALKLIRSLKNQELDTITGYQFFFGIQAVMKGNYRQAIETFTPLIDVLPDNSCAYVNLGFSYYALGEYPQAISYLQKSLKENPDDIRTNHILGMVYYARGNYLNAIQALQQYLKLNDADADALWTLGMSQYISGRYPQARNNFVKAQALFEEEGNKDKVHEIEFFLKELL